jgi:hypothetical protein
MNKAISWLQNLLPRIFNVFLVGITLLVMSAFGNGNQLPGDANTLIAVTSAYQKADSPDTVKKIKNDNKLVERARRNLKENADIAKDNLNFNEPIQNTKEFLNSAQNSVQDAAKSVTENNSGYYERRAETNK